MDTARPDIRNSQNFLHNRKLVSFLINKSSIEINDIVYEIGPGKGIITEELGASCKKVIAIEYDQRLAQNLHKKFEGKKNIEIIRANFLEYKMSESDKFKIFSNIPFNITAEILSKVLALNEIQDIYFIMQYEAFLKYAGAPYYNECLKSLLYKPFFTAELIYNFSAEDFTPIPKARIVFVRFTPKYETDISKNNHGIYRDFLSYIHNENGKSIKEKTKKIFTYEQLKRIGKKSNFSTDCVISSLSYEQWLAMFEVFLKFVPKEKKEYIEDAYLKHLKEQDRLSKQHRNRNQQGGSKKRGKRKFS